MIDTLQKLKAFATASLTLKKAGLHDHAINLLKEAITLKNDYFPAYLLLGSLYKEMGKVELAEDAYRKAYSIDPDNSKTIKGIGLFLHNQERFNEALPYLQKQFKINPSDVQTVFALVSIYLHDSEKKDEINKVLEQAWSMTKNADVGSYLGSRYLRSGNPSAAELIFSEVLSQSKTSETLSEIADSYYYNKMYEKAIDYYLQASVIDPDNGQIWRSLSRCYDRKKDFNKALEAAEFAISKDPKNFQNLQAKNRVLYSLGEYEKTLEISNQIISLIRSSDEPKRDLEIATVIEYMMRFRVFLKLNKPEDALQSLAEGRSLVPNESILYDAPTRYLESVGKFQDALSIIELSTNPEIQSEQLPLRIKLLHLLHRVSEAKNLIETIKNDISEEQVDEITGEGINLFVSGNKTEAILLLEQMLCIDPYSPELITNLAYAQICGDKFIESEELLLQVINFSSIDPFYYQLSVCDLAYLYNIQGKYSEALIVIKKCIDSSLLGEDAYLRVSFYNNHVMHPDHIIYPGRSITISDAIYACAISSALGLKDYQNAEELLSLFSANAQSTELYLMVKGCVEVETGKRIEAAKSWNDALATTKNKEDILEINKWLASIK